MYNKQKPESKKPKFCPLPKDPVQRNRGRFTEMYRNSFPKENDKGILIIQEKLITSNKYRIK